jgi:enamine deaminase RidA (YjgF/YER057c/UK114 family)
MIQKNYTIYCIHEEPFEKMCQSLLDQICTGSKVVKIVFFGSPQSAEEYLEQLQILNNCVEAHFINCIPLITYVSQKPLIGMLNAEVVCLTDSVEVDIVYGDNYVILNDGNCRELITGGILPPNISAPFSIQSDIVFSMIEEILAKEDFQIGNIVRQWNYIENITMVDKGRQHYQDFNDSRSHFYNQAEWEHGYPAATGIGTQQGGIMVEIIAICDNVMINKALDNPLQVPAHRYSQQVLIGEPDTHLKNRTTPKFERARIVGSMDNQTVFISGTAAIRGENSCFTEDVIDQARITMENIDNLISPENYPLSFKSKAYKLLRVYVKNIDQMGAVQDYMTVNYPGVNTIYICADVCRQELLLEIEGIAEMNAN